MLPNPTSQVEVLPKFNPRVYFLAVSYAQGFSHYAYTRSGPKFWNYYDTVSYTHLTLPTICSV